MKEKDFTVVYNTPTITNCQYSFTAHSLELAIAKASELISGDLIKVGEVNDLGEFIDEGFNYTYDVHFNDENDSNNKGFQYSLEDAKGYIDSNNGTNESYFEDYKGGVASVVCNETGETVYEIEIK